ncbi:aldehyde dehydrogenase [Limibacter armeniacum]|uniref:aldehyde dehydrogenase n=1 Tax=Limibacter armeniacum TaxID=466084 RepID=UPI002FE62250
MELIRNYIDGQLCEPINGNYFECFEPATGESYALIPNSDKDDVQQAVIAAKEAFRFWSRTSTDYRHDLLRRMSELIEENLSALASAESKDTGKPISLASTVDIPRAASNFKFFANALTQFASESHEMPHANAINYTLRQPIGVVGCISPWNLPLYLFTWKIAPALAAGNCVIAKPSELTPMTAFLLSKICIEAGLPKGVLNIIHGYGQSSGEAIVSHPEIKAISFTGGTATGARIAAQAAPMFKKLSLELGGKNPNIIFADCRYDQMLQTTIRSSFANQGQICLCGSRILVEKSIYEKFKRDFLEKVQQLAVGDPNNPETQFGALVSKAHMEKVMRYIELAKEEGGEVLTGGNVIQMEGRCQGGWFVAPTVIEGLPADCRTNQEEIFGPVVTIMPFDGEDEALSYANSTGYGLSSTIWTENLSRAHHMAAQIQAGIVWINGWMVRDLRTPFGGIKHSGVGREGGWEALRFFTEPKNVCISYR